MNIVFLSQDNVQVKEESLLPESRQYFNKIKEVITDRLKLISEEINKEEEILSRTITNKAAILFTILEDKINVKPINYSDSLKLKIVNSLADIGSYIDLKLLSIKIIN